MEKSNKIFSDIKFMTAENFSEFGILLELPADPEKKEKGESQFKVMTTQQEVGWRLAYLIVRNRSLKRLENHPYSMESFEPVKGVSLLTVAPHDFPEKVQTFVLDKPVVLHAGIWHDLLTLSEEAEIKITENATIVTEYHPLKSEVVPQICFKSAVDSGDTILNSKIPN